MTRRIDLHQGRRRSADGVRLRVSFDVPDEPTGAEERGAAPAAAPSALPLDTLRQPVVVLVDLPGGRWGDLDHAAVAAARDWADAAGAAVVLVTFGVSLADAGNGGSDAVVCLDGVAADDMRAAAVQAVLQATASQALVAPDGEGTGADAARRVAAALGWAVAARVVEQRPLELLCRTTHAEFEMVLPPCPVRLVDRRYALPLRPRRGSAVPLQPPTCMGQGALTELGGQVADPATVPIAEAEFIVAAGAGVHDWALFHQTVAALGAAAAGSRVVVDAGHLPRERQVGASGTLVKARCYLAFGISGAVQHLEGIAECGFVVSVNPDDACAMAQRADLSLVNDAHGVMRALLEHAQVRKG